MTLRRPLLLLLTLLLAAAGALALGAAPAQAAPPANDNLANAQAIGSFTDTTTVSTTTAEATLESGETGGGAGCESIMNSVWFSYTPATSQPLSVETTGGAAGFDTVLSVFTGASAMYPLTAVACNDEAALGSTHLSKVTLTPSAGTTYYVQVANYSFPEVGDPGPGPIQLRLTTAAGNDALAGATAMPVDHTLDVDNALATKESGEVGQAGCTTLANTMWVKYTAPNDVAGTVTAETVGTRDTVLNVWTGPAAAPQLSDLMAVGCNDDIDTDADNYGSRVTFTPVGGTTYYLQVGTYSVNSAGAFAVRLAVVPGPAPANDQFSAPATITGAVGTTAGTIVPATREIGELANQNQGYTLWYSWTAPSTERYQFSTAANGDPSVDTVLRVITGTLAQPTAVATNDDIDFGGGNAFSRVQFDAVAGTTYRISVGGYRNYPRGPFTLSWRLPSVATTTTLAVSATAQAVDLTATVNPTAATGTVEFFDGTTSVGTAPVVDGPSTLQLTDVAPGAHSYRAVFTPASDDYLPSTSSTQPVTVDPIATATTITAVATGRRVDLTADVVPASGTASPPGAVQFLDGTTSLGNIAVQNGQAVLTVPRISAGSHTFEARYVSSSGDYLDSTDDTTTAVGGSPSTTALTGTVAAQKVTLKAAVEVPDGTTPVTGSVQFFEGTTSRGTVPITNGTATLVLNNVTPGAHTYRAVFTSTNPDVAGSTSANRPVAVPKRTSRTALTAPATVKAGAKPKITVTVKVGTANATGSVKITLNGKPVATVPLAAGRASVTLPALKQGKAKVVASYLGNAATTASSATRTITVTRP